MVDGGTKDSKLYADRVARRFKEQVHGLAPSCARITQASSVQQEDLAWEWPDFDTRSGPVRQTSHTIVRAPVRLKSSMESANRKMSGAGWASARLGSTSRFSLVTSAKNQFP